MAKREHHVDEGEDLVDLAERLVGELLPVLHLGVRVRGRDSLRLPVRPSASDTPEFSLITTSESRFSLACGVHSSVLNDEVAAEHVAVAERGDDPELP